MENKPKKCKGIGKAISVKGCGNLTLWRKYGLCANCAADFFYGTDAGKMIMYTHIMPKAKNKVIANEKEKTKKLKEKITEWDLKLRTQLQKISRLIDYNLPCLARGVYGQIHGGHILAAGGNKTISYNLHNIHRQSAHSNHFQNDDGLLREGLKKEYGEEYLNFIMDLRRTESLNYKNEVYHAFYLKARKISLELEKKALEYSLPERISLRNEINLKMNIYKEEYCVYNG